MQSAKNIKKIKQLFLEKYKDNKTELHYTNEFELLIAVMLSAQCTDKRVNIVTPELFKKYKNAHDLANADINDVKEIIKSVSFFNMKAKHLIQMAQQIIKDFNAKVPLNQKDLMSLSGVGQKSANVVLGEFLGLNYMAVDTHVFRVSHRLDLSDDKTPKDTEKTLSDIFKDNLNILHQAFVLFGRYDCKALNPKCALCFVKDFCKSTSNFKPA